MITFTTGLMGSGKSKSLIESFKNDDSIKIALAAHLNEETGAIGVIESRNGSSIGAIYLNSSDDYLTPLILTMIQGVKTVYIDEVQFLPKSVVSKIIEIADQQKIDVHFFGLETTFTGDLFESAKFLIETLDPNNITYIPRLCQKEGCFNPASYNARIIGGKIARTGNTFLEEKSTYLALCKNHYFE